MPGSSSAHGMGDYVNGESATIVGVAHRDDKWPWPPSPSSPFGGVSLCPTPAESSARAERQGPLCVDERANGWTLKTNQRVTPEPQGWAPTWR